MSDRPITTLFLMTSVDGKISTGNSDQLDVDIDFPKIDGVKQGLHQYYEIEETTDLWSLNTGRVMQKIGINERKDIPEKMDVSFVIIDNKPHLNDSGIAYLCKWVKQLILVTTSKNHPACTMNIDNLSIIYQEELNLTDLMKALKSEYHVERITIQSGGTLNERFLREKLFDYVNIVIAPILIGGKDTASLIDGNSITKSSQLNLLSALKLEECNVLKDSYIQLKYKVIK
jgi:2,5-diamino-6-(ribosylamino)-4(3H)-pyrimidinone 5'-phosphate reductase